MHKAAKGSQVKNKSTRLQADSCLREPGPNQTTEPACSNRSFRFALLLQSNQDGSTQVRSNVFFSASLLKKCIVAVMREAPAWFCLISKS